MCLSLQLNSSRDGLPGMRDELRSWLTDAGIPQEEAEDIVLACWEAAVNAVEHPVHTTGDIRVAAERHSDQIILCVANTGSWRLSVAPRQEGGLGLRLIGGLMDRVRVIQTPHGTLVLMGRLLRQGERRRGTTLPV